MLVFAVVVVASPFVSVYRYLYTWRHASKH